MDSAVLKDIILNATSEPIVIVDNKGCITELSKAYAEFLEIDRDQAIGKHVSEVIENSRMHIVLETGKAEIAKTQKIKGKTMIATRIPIVKNGEIMGVYGRVLFKDIKELYSLYGRINEIEQELSFYKKRYGKINIAKYSVDDIIGESPEILEMKKSILKVGIGNSNILITGESGTGKELVAHAIHSASRRKENPLICLNCAAIPSQLLESELFGYEEGAFTGAKKGGKPGLFHAANKGTLFLDEIGDLSMSMQVKLLRAIQDKEIRRVGSSTGENVDVRIVAATNKNLAEMIEENTFRADLFYRLNVVSITIPPVRKRKSDIPILVQFFLNKIAENEGIYLKGISNAAMEYLKQYDWPGNIRELENTLERASNFVDDDGIIKPKDLINKITGGVNPYADKQLKEIVEEAERNALINALMRFEGRKTLIAKELGISRTSLYEKLEKYKIDLM
ncbi:sigma-54 interaction domain-containing protein [Aminipila sp.]|uniref:sigma-54 interaction domain-containing protein n=1 Tax=Aminipila sp. TaxID=2060095 RepID=UPI00289F4922|nr:sigma 54-interacting transcriptional regulator [Aminipila sp.]